MFDDGNDKNTYIEAQPAERIDVVEAKPKPKPRAKRVKKVEEEKKHFETPTDPEEILEYVIQLRKIRTEKVEEQKADKCGKASIVIQGIDRKISQAMASLAPKEVSYSDVRLVSLSNNSMLGHRLPKNTFYDDTPS